MAFWGILWPRSSCELTCEVGANNRKIHYASSRRNNIMMLPSVMEDSVDSKSDMLRTFKTCGVDSNGEIGAEGTVNG